MGDRFSFIGNCGVAKLADALRRNNTLQVLDLSRNHIGDEGAEDLAELLKNNYGIRKLNLCATPITATGIFQLALALIKNETLQELRLSEKHYFNLEVLQYLQKAININYTLLALPGFNRKIIERNWPIDDITGLEDAKSCLEDIEKYLQRNNSIYALFIPIENFCITLDLNEELLYASQKKIKAHAADFEAAGKYHSITESKRLLHALFYYNNNKWLALKQLEGKFIHPALQAKADLICGSVLVESNFNPSSTYCSLILYSLRRELSHPKLPDVFLFFLTTLVYPTDHLTDDETRMLCEKSRAIQLLNYKTLMVIAKLARELTSEEDEDEFLLLTTILNRENSYSAQASAFLWQSSLFIEVLQKHYPGKEKFAVIEDVVHTPTEKSIRVLPETMPVVSKAIVEAAIAAIPLPRAKVVPLSFFNQREEAVVTREAQAIRPSLVSI